MTMTSDSQYKIDIPFNRDVFVNCLLGELAELLQTITGDDDASGLISMVGLRLGALANKTYRLGFNTDQLSFDQVKFALVDLKKRIEGDFYVVSADPEKIVFKNNQCPFGQHVVGRTSLCMITSNVFGTVASENLGYAKVSLHHTIADGSKECHVVVYLQKTAEALACDGREYFKEHNEIEVLEEID